MANYTTKVLGGSVIACALAFSGAIGLAKVDKTYFGGELKKASDRFDAKVMAALPSVLKK